jgi:hypothetical protein
VFDPARGAFLFDERFAKPEVVQFRDNKLIAYKLHGVSLYCVFNNENRKGKKINNTHTTNTKQSYLKKQAEDFVPANTLVRRFATRHSSVQPRVKNNRLDGVMFSY